MAKKLLSEAQVRRFAKLANLSPINEMYNMEEEEETPMEEGMYDEEEEDVADAEAPPAEEEPAEEMPEEEPEMDMGGEDLELTDEEAQAIIDLGKKLEAAMPEGGAEEPEMDMGGEEMPAEEPEMDMAGEEEAEEEIMEALKGINYVPGKKEIVEEVARRVAKRLLKAKRAEKDLNEALGKNKK